MSNDESATLIARMLRRIRWSWVLASIGLAWSARSVLDSFRLEGALLGPVLVGIALLSQVWLRREWKRLAFAFILSIAYSISAFTLIEFRADSSAYFSYLRSASFDRDLDFANDWEALGLPGVYTGGGAQRHNVFSVGPALVWSPFYAVAHAYVRWENWRGQERFEVNGYSLPYRRATALGTVTVVVVGASLLFAAIIPLVGFEIALLSGFGSVLASPVLYYTFAVPAMSHGVTFGVAAVFIWAWTRARTTPSLQAWLLLGAVLGLLTLCRWQAALYGVLALPLALDALRRSTLRPVWLVASVGAGALAFAPQIVVWKLLFGRWLLIPQGRGFLDFSSANWSRTLFSADHGFFNWTPLMLLGFLGLVLGLRKDRMLYGGALFVFAATVWVNGSVPDHDWAAGDAFGARRYSLVVPLIALGLAVAIEASCRVLRRVPVLAPAVLVVLATLWNVGFISHFRARKYREMAPLEHLARDQARSLRWATQDVFGFVAGQRGRAFAYEVLSAEYFYTSFNRNGRIYLRSADERYLLHGWHTPSRRIARRTFRRALYPEACVRIPLREAFPLRIAVTARAPEGALPQVVSLTMNGNVLTSASLTPRFKEIRFLAPEGSLVAGENALCLQFSNGLPEDKGRRVAAHVERIQLP